MNTSSDRPNREPVDPVESQSQDAARREETESRPPWETRQPAQVTKADVEEARAKPEEVSPPGEMGESQGAAS